MKESPQVFSREADCFYVPILVFLAGILFLPQLFSGQVAVDAPYLVDITTQFYPIYKAVASSYQVGEFPLWYPHFYCGVPLLGHSPGGGMYPIGVFFFQIAGYFRAATLTMFFHVAMGAVFSYALFRTLRLRPFFSFLGAQAFAFSGAQFYLINTLPNMHTINWFPLILLLVYRLHQQRRWIYLTGIVLVAMMMGYAGDTELFAYCLMGIYLFILWGLEPAQGRFRTALLVTLGLGAGLLLVFPQFLTLMEFTHHSIRSDKAFDDINFLFFLIRWKSYLPTIFLPFLVYKVVIPPLAYNHALPPLYIGILFLTMGGLSLYWRKRDPVIPGLWKVIIFFLIYIVLMNLPALRPVVRHLPLLGKMMVHLRSFQLAQLLFILVALKAMERFWENPSVRVTRILAFVFFFWGMATIFTVPVVLGGVERYILGACLILGAALFFLQGFLSRAWFFRLGAGFFAVIVLLDIYGLALRAIPRTDIEAYQLDPEISQFWQKVGSSSRFHAFEVSGNEAHPHTDTAGTMRALLSADTPYGIMRLPLSRYFQILLLADPDILFQLSPNRRQWQIYDLVNPHYLSEESLQIFNLMGVRYFLSRGFPLKLSSPHSLINVGLSTLFNRRGISTPKELSAQDTKGAKNLTFEMDGPHASSFQTYIYPGDELALGLMESDGRDYPLFFSLFFKDPAASRTHLAFCRSLNILSSNSSDKTMELLIPLTRFENRVWQVTLARTDNSEDWTPLIIDDPRIIRKGMPLKRVHKGEISIYENRDALARAFLVHRFRVVPEPEALKNLLNDPQRFKPGEEVLFERPDDTNRVVEQYGAIPSEYAHKELVRLVDYQPQRILITCNALSPGYLFLSDVYYPGWRVWVDKAEMRIFRADYAFRAVFLDKGTHQVEFRYQPYSFRIGLWVCLAALLFQVIFLAIRKTLV